MNRFETVVFCYARAHEILWKLGYWRYLLLPITLSVLILPLLTLAFFLSYSALAPLLERIVPGASQYPYLALVFLVLALVFGMAGPFFVLYRSLVMLCYSPFLNRLSRAVEETISGSAKTEGRGITESLRRVFVVALSAVLLSVAVVIMGLILNLIPILGTILFVLVVPPVQMYLASLSYVDPYLDRKGLGAVASFKLMARNAVSMTLFGAVGLGIMMIPVVGWFVGPTYSVVAGIVFAMILLGEGPGRAEENKRSPAPKAPHLEVS